MQHIAYIIFGLQLRVGISASRKAICHSFALSILVKWYVHSYTQDLKTDPKDEFLAILRATVKCLTRSEKYFEKIVRLSINKRGTDEGALTRVVTTRAEIDMKLIKDEYHRRNSVPLDRAIAKDTNGHYEDMLLALIGHGDA